MESTENEKQLLTSLQKCRCCFRILLDNTKAVEIDETIKNQFFCLTQIELLSSELFASRICQLCQIDLQTFFELRKDLIAKQSALYELAGFDLNEQQEEILEQEEDYEVQMIEDENFVDDQVILEEIDSHEYEQSEIIYDDTKETQNDSILKIEKISCANDDDSCQESEYLVRYENYLAEVTDDVSMTSQDNNSGEDVIVETKVCEVCDIEVLKSHFSEHVELMHGDEENCTICHVKFKSKIQLKRHINEEHSCDPNGRKNRKKLHYCPLCSKEYDYKKQLVDHIRSFHKKERNAQCPVCKRRFYHRDLKKHIQHVHGEKKISCEVCGKMYTCLENLKLHLKYHSEPKYICEHENCGKKFHQKTLWEHHILKHKNERTIPCSECTNFFYTERDLKRHFQRLHKKVTRKCFGCEMTFCRKDKYREHVIKHHKEFTGENRAKILEQIKNLKWHEN